MRDADTKTDAGAHGTFTLAHNGHDGRSIGGFEFAGGDQAIDEFIDCLPAINCIQIHDDLFSAENVTQIHTALTS